MPRSNSIFKIKNVWLFVFSLTFSFLFFGLDKAAAETRLYFDPQENIIGTENEFLISVNIDATDSINALEIAISIPPELEPLDTNDGNSIINLWIQKPHYDDYYKLLTFSGIIPGGFSGKSGRLLIIKFRVKQAGIATLTFKKEETRVLLNNPEATEDILELSEAKLPIIAGKENINSLPPDTSPPEIFVPQIAKDPNLFSNRYFLVFSTQDKGRGIDHYEVLEKIESKIFNLSLSSTGWETAESPYLLNDQRLTSRIFVKAVDRSGNTRNSELSPQKLLPWYKDFWVWVIILLGLALLSFGVAIFYKKAIFKNQKK